MTETFNLKRRATCDLCGRTSLRWSSAVPTESGWYWWRVCFTLPAEVVRVVPDCGDDRPGLGVMATNEADVWMIDELSKGQWAGPIQPPE